MDGASSGGEYHKGGGMSEWVLEQQGATTRRRQHASFYAARVARDAALAARVKQGDGEALAELYRIYYGSLCRTASLTVGDEAPDVVQKVFCNVWLGRDH